MKGPSPATVDRMRRTVSCANIRNRPKCHHGAPADNVVRLRFTPDTAWLWIGGEAAPIECYAGRRQNKPGVEDIKADPVALARKVAARLRKRLVIVEE